ncbi:MAG: xanthine dehydrogenase family protein molybdopterin-binding subunit, partial [Acidimicrobiia bacterium]
NGDRYATGEVVDDMHFDRLIDDVVGSLDTYRREHRSGSADGTGANTRRGRAIATTMKATITPSTSTAAIKLNEDGSVNVLTSSVDLGQGMKTALAQIAAGTLDVPYHKVQVSEPDTDITPYDQQTSSSRTTYSMGNSVIQAAEDIRRQLVELGAEQLEAAVEDVELRDGVIQVRGAPARALTYEQALRRARRGTLQGVGAFITEGGLDPETGQGIASVHWHHGAAGCEAEVDLETGKVEILHLTSAVFAGKVINPRLCELQIEGSLLFGLGQALFEEIAYEDGQVTNANLSDYMIPSFDDLPDTLHVSLLEADTHGDIHGVGETALPQVSPVIANAIRDAVGVHINDLPLTAEKVLRALSQGQVGHDDGRTARTTPEPSRV